MVILISKNERVYPVVRKTTEQERYDYWMEQAEKLEKEVDTAKEWIMKHWRDIPYEVQSVFIYGDSKYRKDIDEYKRLADEELKGHKSRMTGH